MEAETRTGTLDESPQMLRQRTRLLQATWDTMGWVYFPGRPAGGADRYVRASLRGWQDAEVGKRIWARLQRRDRTEALKDDDLAIGTIPKIDEMGVHTGPRSQDKELLGRAETLREHGVHSNVMSPQTARQELRALFPGKGKNGVAEYKLLISAAGLERMEPTGAKTVPEAETRLQHANFGPLLPAGTQAKLVLTGMLNCHHGSASSCWSSRDCSPGDTFVKCAQV